MKKNILVFFLVALFAAAPAFAGGAYYSPAQSLYDLKQGNLRFVGEKQLHPRQDKEKRRQSLPEGLHPKAVIVSCADARVPVEALFDQGIGDLFVFRIPGNTAGRDVQVGIWYALSKLDVPLIVVLGHNDCMAVNSVWEGETRADMLPDVYAAVQAAKAENQGKNLNENALKNEAVRKNVEYAIDMILEKQPGIAEMIVQDKVRVAGAIYNIESGRVEWLDY